MNNNGGDSNQSWASASDDGQIGDLDEHHEKPYEVKIDEIKLSEKSDQPVWQDGIIKTEDFEPLQHDRMFRCKYITMIVVMSIVIIGTSVGFYLWLEHHLTFLILILLFNTFLILTWAKTGIS
jgi:hypothetical protein